MYFYLIGTDYRATSLTELANLYRLRSQLVDFWRDKEVALLFTCNRIEIYALAKNTDAAFSKVAEFSRSFPDFSRNSYVKYGRRQVFEHALRLASGLKSQLEGELQIFLQLKSWLQRQVMPPLLKEFWDEVLLLAEDIRTRSGLDKDVPDIAGVVFYDLHKYISSDKPLEITVVGTGKIAGLLARYHDFRFRINFVANKNFAQAKILASYGRGKAFRLKDLARAMSKTNVLISATSSPHYVLRKEHFLDLQQPIFVYDLALPADVEPKARSLPGVYLQDLDDLKETIKQFNQNSRERITLANSLIEEISGNYGGIIYAQNN